MYNRLSTSLYCSSPAKCCSGAQSASSQVGTIMENITKTYGSLFQQMERLIWFHTLKFLEKKDSVLQFIQSNLKPSGKRTLGVPPSLLEICLFKPSYPLEFPRLSIEWVWIFSAWRESNTNSDITWLFRPILGFTGHLQMHEKGVFAKWL